jgi:hypothetical protein
VLDCGNNVARVGLAIVTDKVFGENPSQPQGAVANASRYDTALLGSFVLPWEPNDPIERSD